MKNDSESVKDLGKYESGLFTAVQRCEYYKSHWILNNNLVIQCNPPEKIRKVHTITYCSGCVYLPD